MSNDGATYGITAKQALGGVLGGDDIPAEAHQTREQVRARIDAAPRLADIYVRTEHVTESYPDSDLIFDGDQDVLYVGGQKLAIDYGGCADIAARAILDFIETHPDHADAPGENEYAKNAYVGLKGDGTDWPTPVRLGIYDLMKNDGYDLGKLGLTGFQWGFAYNLARWLRYEEGQGNPAIIEVGVMTTDASTYTPIIPGLIRYDMDIGHQAVRLVEGAAHPLRAGAVKALDAIAAEPGITASDIAADAGLERQTIAGVTVTLIKKGYVQFRKDPADMRLTRFYLTLRGEVLVAELRAKLAGLS